MTDTLRDRLGALMREWRKQDDTTNGICNNINFCCHGLCAHELEAELAAQPAPAVMGEGAMRRLINECKAVLAFEHELREISVLGNTNVNAFKLRVEEAEAELGRTAAAESREEPK